VWRRIREYAGLKGISLHDAVDHICGYPESLTRRHLERGFLQMTDEERSEMIESRFEVCLQRGAGGVRQKNYAQFSSLSANADFLGLKVQVSAVERAQLCETHAGREEELQNRLISLALAGSGIRRREEECEVIGEEHLDLALFLFEALDAIRRKHVHFFFLNKVTQESPQYCQMMILCTDREFTSITGSK